MSGKHTNHGNEHSHPGVEGDTELSHYARRFQAIEALLIERGVCTPDELQLILDELELRTPADGARVVARAWADAESKARLLADPKAAIAEIGYIVPGNVEQLTVLENTDQVHHMVVCTLCSCYPSVLLGRPPDWYKSVGCQRVWTVLGPRDWGEEAPGLRVSLTS